MRAWERPALTEKDLSVFNPITEGVRHAATLVLYEGLPHPVWEKAQFKQELATQKTIQVHRYPFYEHSLLVAPEDVESLRRLCADPGSYWSYSGPKLCGGYHPDYCLAWNDGNRTYELLICFGCHEMKLYDAKHELKADVREGAYKRLQEILQKYHAKRPKPAKL